MIKFENCEVLGWEHAIRGMRNPMNSWNKMDSGWKTDCTDEHLIVDSDTEGYFELGLGPNDRKLMMNLRNAGTDHRKFMRMIVVYADITAPLYWWKEMDTYRVGVEKNSCSTMHKIAAKEFTLEDFSHEHLVECDGEWVDILTVDPYSFPAMESTDILKTVVEGLNRFRSRYLETKDKKYWWQMIQLLPSSYNQRRTVMLNYEVLANIYKSRRNHKLDEWRELCAWIERLPYSELITGKREEDLVFKIPKDHISPEALELLEKGFAVDMSLGFKEE